MDIKEIIKTKMDKKELNTSQIDYFVKNYTNGNITDEQASALVYAIYFNNLSKSELGYLTYKVSKTGKQLDLSTIDPNIVDKHSTGGVGDKITLILLPLLAGVGVKVAKLSGKSLGFTGGTIDKLESIPGFSCHLSYDNFKNNILNKGIAINAQTTDLAPIDGKLYGLRDRIDCVNNNSLIASSIMSKKLACGAKNIVLEVTVGSGAFCKDKQTATHLAKDMIDIAKENGKKAVCVLTNMDQVLGCSVGNVLEVKEAVNFLNGQYDNFPHLQKIVLTIGSYMYLMYNNKELTYSNLSIAKNILYKALVSKAGYNKFIELVTLQGGNEDYIKNLNLFEKPKYEKDIYVKNGYLTKMDTQKIGQIANYLATKSDGSKDKSAGIVLNKKLTHKIDNDKVATVYSNDLDKIHTASKDLAGCFTTTEQNIDQIEDILDIIY